MVAIAIVGEAWGVEEARLRQPFVGWTGRLLTEMLADAGIHRADCFLTNVFNLHPHGNEIRSLCTSSKENILPDYPALLTGSQKWVHRQYEAELQRLADELVEEDPNVIIATGNVPMWALLGKTGISKFRGYADITTHTATGFKIIPVYHPSAVNRQIELRPTTVLDLAKALRESEYPDLRRPSRKIYIPETIEDLYEYERNFIQQAEALSVDIETVGRHITCIGFAPNTETALVVPFFDRRRKDKSYWPDGKDERLAWKFVRRVCATPIPKTFQNGLYDIAFLWRFGRIAVNGVADDTMLLHHALQPESLKGLGFLGSIYTNEGPWKEHRENVTTIKSDE